MYIKKIDGYIVDVPKAIFTRCDGRRFVYDNLASCNFSPTIDPLTINGGWSMYPRAIINAGATADITMTSAEFRADLFELAHAATMKEVTDYTIIEAKKFDVDTGLTITLPTGALNPTISGMELSDTAAEGKFTYATNKITFHTGDFAVGDTVQVEYEVKVSGHSIPVDVTGASAKGSLQLEYPVYSSGTDCTEASRKGTWTLTIYRVRVSAMPGFDSSYKTAVTNGVTFSVLDPERSDFLMWNWFYRPAEVTP